VSDKPIINVDAMVHPLHEEIQHHILQLLVMNAEIKGIAEHTHELLTQCGCDQCKEVLDHWMEPDDG